MAVTKYSKNQKRPKCNYSTAFFLFSVLWYFYIRIYVFIRAENESYTYNFDFN